MVVRSSKGSRRQEILQALAMMLEASNNERITTAALAKQIGFTEAALYKHFPSKTTMYEGLLDFADEALFTRINAISRESENSVRSCAEMLLATLTFAERNPGITRLVCGDALYGEHDRLQKRAGLFFERLASALKQQIKLGEIRESLLTNIPPGMAAGLMTNLVEGRLHQFVRTRYQEKPTRDWQSSWPVIEQSLFRQ